MLSTRNEVKNESIVWWDSQSSEVKHLMTILMVGPKMSYKKLNFRQIEQLHKEFSSNKSKLNKLKKKK